MVGLFPLLFVTKFGFITRYVPNFAPRLAKKHAQATRHLILDKALANGFDKKLGGEIKIIKALIKNRIFNIKKTASLADFETFSETFLEKNVKQKCNTKYKPLKKNKTIIFFLK